MKARNVVRLIKMLSQTGGDEECYPITDEWVSRAYSTDWSRVAKSLATWANMYSRDGGISGHGATPPRRNNAPWETARLCAVNPSASVVRLNRVESMLPLRLDYTPWDKVDHVFIRPLI